MTSSIDIHTLNKMLGAGDAPVLLDVRRKADYEATPQKIAGARWCDPENIDRLGQGSSFGPPHRSLLRQGRIGQPIGG